MMLSRADTRSFASSASVSSSSGLTSLSHHPQEVSPEARSRHQSPPPASSALTHAGKDQAWPTAVEFRSCHEPSAILSSSLVSLYRCKRSSENTRIYEMGVGRSGIPDLCHRRSSMSAQRSLSWTSSRLSNRVSSHLAPGFSMGTRQNVCSSYASSKSWCIIIPLPIDHISSWPRSSSPKRSPIV